VIPFLDVLQCSEKNETACMQTKQNKAALVGPEAVAQGGHEEGQCSGHAGKTAGKALVLDERRQSGGAGSDEAEEEERAHSDGFQRISATLLQKDVREVNLDLGGYAAGLPVLDPLHASVGFVVPEKFGYFGRAAECLDEVCVVHAPI
jgi:hypothetical protein